jgi:alkanesulfonate monooxygenase SsuD/methylene tetrahydromethanopterin reductase-like flavin-dependent oxidoreductase (luciferase family)
MPGIASAATAIVIGHVAAATSRIRVGSGGVMLPNHSPLVIAEQFGTLAALFPDRIDLGLGRAPGTDMRTARALRRNLDAGAENFPHDIVELHRLLGEPTDDQPILEIPGANSNIPLCLLGSREAARLFTSAQQQFVNLRKNVRGQFPRPVDSMDGHWTEMERMTVEHTLRYAAVGSPATVADTLSRFLAETEADELIVSMPIHDIDARLKSVELFAGLQVMEKAH